MKSKNLIGKEIIDLLSNFHIERNLEKENTWVTVKYSCFLGALQITIHSSEEIIVVSSSIINSVYKGGIKEITLVNTLKELKSLLCIPNRR